MNAQGWLQIAVYLVLLTALTPVVGAYMTRVYRGERIALLSTVLGPLERLTLRAIRADGSAEQDWKSYARTAIVFSALSWGALYLILRTLARHRGRLLTHRGLLVEVWGPEYADDTAVLRTHIANLRRKIEPDPGKPRLIRTDSGVGYRLIG